MQNDAFALIFDLLKTWAPLVPFIGVWLYAMRRYNISHASSPFLRSEQASSVTTKHVAVMWCLSVFGFEAFRIWTVLSGPADREEYVNYLDRCAVCSCSSNSASSR